MFRRFSRQWFAKKNKHQILYYKQRFAIVYAFVGWNCFGILLYAILNKEMPNKTSLERRQSLSQLAGTSENMHVYQLEGLQLTKEFDVVYKAKNKKEAKVEKEEKEES